MATDPICGMDVDESAPLKTEFEGKTYYFCSTVCKNAFDKEPHRYVSEGRQEK